MLIYFCVHCPGLKSPTASKGGKGAIYLPKAYYLNGLDQRSVDFFCKRPDNKHFWLWGHTVAVATTQTLPVVEEQPQVNM